jgi:hypothetical protein
MNLMKQHTYPLTAWVAVALGHESPDARITVKKVTPLPDRCTLTFTYASSQAPDAAFMDGVKVKAVKDFWAGEGPVMKRVILTADPELGDPGAQVIIEWIVRADSVVYRAETATLYVCAPTKVL